MAQDLKPILLAAAQQYGVDPAIAQRVMHIESRGNPNAVSPAGAIGAMQLMPGTARDLGVDPNDPVQNVQGGVRYLAQMINEFGPEYGPLAYNAGPGRMRRVLAGEAAMPAETQNYQRLMRGDNMPVLQRSMAALNGGVTPLEIIGGREGNLKVQDPSQISPEAVQATDNINRMQEFKRQMLPLAMGAMMSGDVGSRNYGQNTFREAMEGVEPFKMQNGFLTDEGQYITDQDQSGLLKMTIDQMRKDMTAQRDQGNKNLEFELKLADDYRQNTKNEIGSINAFKKFETGVANGMTDMAMVFNFMRILDPESTVKTSEFESVAKARGVPDSIAQLLPKAMAGEILTQPQRDQIKSIGLKFASDAADNLEGQYNYVKGIAGKNNLNVDNVIQPMHGEWIKDIRTKRAAAAEREANAAKPTGQVGTTGTSQTGGRGVQSGGGDTMNSPKGPYSVVTDPDGTQRVVWH